MIIVVVKSGLIFKYRGKITMNQDREYFRIKAEHSEENWNSLTADVFPMIDVKLIRHIPMRLKE